MTTKSKRKSLWRRQRFRKVGVELEDTESTIDLAALAKETFAEGKVTTRDHVQTDLSTVPVTIVGRKVTQNRNVLASNAKTVGKWGIP